MALGTGVNLIQAIYAIVAVNSVVLAGVLYRHRERIGAIPLLVNVLATGLWAASLLARTAVDPASTVAHALLVSLFLGVGLYLLTLLVFTLEYTGREQFVKPTTIALLSLEPILVLVVVAVNPGQRFFTVVDGTVEWGIVFWANVVYGYAILAVATVLIAGRLYRSQSIYRGQTAMLVVGTVAAWAANALYVFGPVDVEISPVGFLVMGALYAVAITRYRLTDIVPIARDRVLANVSDAVFVVDEQDRLIDLNPVGRDLLEDIDSSPIGADIDTLLAGRPELREGYRDLTATPTSGDREFELSDGHYHFRTTPIEDGRGRHVGWLFMIRDITDRKRREAQLERQNERLEQFADLVSHDLRNPLNVANGYLDLAREADDDAEYLEEIEQSHDRMETIIEDVLTLAREGADVADPEPVALAAIADRAWSGVDTGAASIATDADVTVLADPERTTRLLENLFRNAIEHGSERADSADLEITVGTVADPSGGSVTGFYVADDGVGIPSSKRENVFEAGYTTDEDGTGFGLSIVDEIATAHEWTSSVTESETGGARFEFRGVETAGEASASNGGSEPDLEADSAGP
ncbi:histidine kinase N-terminal 7TM domain-containing protein [Natrinema sp. J7-2]|uniref:histidine kinase N-terminal 7TM domain-containing protein n=1 Tax=Natrinema sp. (strain J7-2) TaxID=406552 RepID=UPI00026D4A5C|nr:histidine kinase N-terminal 7TM domain-containing protein [Natrinema sp. J7-2]AFO56411.1 multi-sensor signal transduction histidine kinase [Natrinema sp. J7-2]